MGETGRERAERDERFSFARPRFDDAHRLEEPLDHVHTEREPLAGAFAERGRRNPQGPSRFHDVTRRDVARGVVPGPEAARPHAGPVHHVRDDLVAPRSTCELDATIEQYEPVVGRLAFAEQHLTGRDIHLVTDADQILQLFVGEAVEQEDRAQIFQTGHLRARRPKSASSFVCNGESSGTGTGGANNPVSCRCSAIGSVRS